MKDLWAGVVVSDVEQGVLKFLLIKSRSTLSKYRDQQPQKKFSGGGDNDHPEDGSPLATALRELREETGLHPKAGVVPEEIHREYHKNHVKVFYHLSFKDCEGELRLDEEILDGDDLLSLEMVKVNEAVWVIYKTHYEALQAAIKHLTSLVR